MRTLPARWTDLGESDGRAERAASCAFGALFRSMKGRGEEDDRARRFTLQQAVTLLAESAGLAPPQLFAPVDPVDPTPAEQDLIAEVAREEWSRIHPSVLGTILEATLHERARRARGAHYTPEAAIFDHVVRPSLVDPWLARIRAASGPRVLRAIHEALAGLRVLDPACGSGNFLYVAYRAMKRIEIDLVERMREAQVEPDPATAVRTAQLFGIDADPLACELARITMIIADRRAVPDPDRPPPRLTANVRCDDALFCAWPPADLILGNPPFVSKNRMQQDLGAAYVQRVRRRFPDVPGRADHCVFWFRRAHDALAPGGRAGFVGTNTIRQNASREGGLDYIVDHGGTITEAVSTMVWPGEALVHVSVANWIKGDHEGPKRLVWQEGDAQGSPWRDVVLDRIPASLSPRADVTRAKPIAANATAGACYQGQTHGHEGFVLSLDEARAMCAASPENREVIFPYLIGEDLLAAGGPSRWVIDLGARDRREAERYEEPFRRVVDRILPDRELAAARERTRNAALRGGARGNQHHDGFLRRFWQLAYPRRELCSKLASIPRYIACSRVTKRPIFAFVSAAIHPSDALAVFPFADDYTFGVLQSGPHWAWLTARCSTLTARFRYTSETVFDSFPWPQSAAAPEVSAVAKAAVALRAMRRGAASLRALYASAEGAARHPLHDAHAALDDAVRAAYGMAPHDDALAFLLALNHACAAREARGEAVIGPGLPPGVPAGGLVTSDAFEAPVLG